MVWALRMRLDNLLLTDLFLSVQWCCLVHSRLLEEHGFSQASRCRNSAQYLSRYHAGRRKNSCCSFCQK